MILWKRLVVDVFMKWVTCESGFATPDNEMVVMSGLHISTPWKERGNSMLELAGVEFWCL
jgi:hypothetical protein